MAAVIALAVYTVVVHPYSGSSGYSLPPQGPSIAVYFGTPSITSVACGFGGSAFAERIPWNYATGSVTTGDLNARVYEIADGDYIADPNAVANATGSNVCAGPAPSPETVWYVVLVAPNGTNLLTYTVDQGWVPVAGGPSNLGVENDSALILITHASFAGTGRGFSVYGIANQSPISGSVPL